MLTVTRSEETILAYLNSDFLDEKDIFILSCLIGVIKASYLTWDEITEMVQEYPLADEEMVIGLLVQLNTELYPRDYLD